MSPYSSFSFCLDWTIKLVFSICFCFSHFVIFILNLLPLSVSSILLLTIAVISIYSMFLYLFSNLFSLYKIIEFEIILDIMNMANVWYVISFFIYFLVIFIFLNIRYIIIQKNRAILFLKYSPTNIPIIYPIVIISILFIYFTF